MHQFVKLQAAKSALQIIHYNKVPDGDLAGHLRIIKDFKLNMDIRTVEDWMITKTNYDVPFKVVKQCRYVWDAGGRSLRPGSIIFYTDGSKMGENTGAGVFGPGISPTVFQAKVQAILECANICLIRN